MSHWIEYQSACFLIPDGFRGVKGTRFLIASEGGSNNLTQRTPGGQERRVREWYVSMVGRRDDVLRQAVRIAGDCEGMSLRLKGRTITPEAYIRRTRRLLAKPRTDADEHISLVASVTAGHPLVSRAAHFGMTTVPEKCFGEELVHVYPPIQAEPDWGAFFRAVDPFLFDGSIQPGRLGQVWGLPPS